MGSTHRWYGWHCVFASLALVALATPAQAAFKVVQAKDGNYVPKAGPKKCGAGTCTTVLKPLTVTSLGAGTAANLKNFLDNNLTPQYPGYTYAYGGDLNIDFVISKYKAFNDGTNGGGMMNVDFTVQVTDPVTKLPDGLKWVQLVTDNYNFTGRNGKDLTAATGAGKPESVIDGTFPKPSPPAKPCTATPFYDDFCPGDPVFATSPPHFEDFSQRPEPDAANPVITWLGDLYLVSLKGKEITFYDGVEWGWETTFVATKAPEPDVWVMMIIGFGLAGTGLRVQRRPQTA
jgi:hypothetical protein